MTTEAVQELYAQLGRAVQDEEEAIAVYTRMLRAIPDGMPDESTIRRIVQATLSDEHKHKRALLYALELLQRSRTAQSEGQQYKSRWTPSGEQWREPRLYQ